LSSAFVPFLSDKFTKDRVSADKYISDLININFIITLSVYVINFIFAKYIILLFMPGFYEDYNLINTGIGLLRILMLYLPFITVCGLLSGYLNVNRSYFVPHSSTVLLNISMITGAIIGGIKGLNIYILAWSVCLGGLLQLIYVAYFSSKIGYHYYINKNIDMDVKKTFHLVIPSIVGLSMNQLNFTVGRILASFLSAGSISYLYYANRLYQLPIGVFSVAAGVVSLTELSIAASKSRQKDRTEIIDNAILVLILFVLPSFIGLFLLSKEIVELIYFRFNFTEESVIQTAKALKMYSLGLLFISLGNILIRVFHSEKNLVTPVRVSFICFVVNIVLNVIFMFFLGHAGIALGSSVASALNAVLLYRAIKNYSFSFIKYRFFIIKLLFSTFIMVIALFIFKIFHINVLINIILCVVIYLVMLKILKINIREFAL
jgi:putative peptidoglycan lipid II flippase